MKFSVIIPMYNSKSTIAGTLDSVIHQTYKEPIEIIVINDGSTDGCKIVVEKLILDNQTNRVIKLINKPNGGVSSARNRGIKEANGEYMAFLDSDDVWHPQKLEIIEKLLKEDNINFIAHAFTLEDNSQIVYQKDKIEQISFLSLLIKNFAVTPSVVIKKSICGYFNESMSHTEDHELWLRTSLKHSVYYINLPLTTIGRPQLSLGGLSSNRWEMRKGELQMYINIAKEKKVLIIFLPFLFAFSLLKHFRNYIKDFFAKN